MLDWNLGLMEIEFNLGFGSWSAQFVSLILILSDSSFSSEKKEGDI